MLFNSLPFLVFLPIVFAAYWSLNGRLRAQNALVLTASYVFYGWWDPRFLSLVAFSSLVDYVVARSMALAGARRARRLLLYASLAANLGLLGFFKYFNFFAASFADLLRTIGLEASWVTLNIVLPVGISFYTFQTLSYTIDVYRGKLHPTKDLVAFLAYVSFFPQLVAGPIERASRLLPQFLAPRTFDPAAASDGLRQILWGFFKKVAVADTCGLLADGIFGAYTDFSTLTLGFGVFCFALQIYGDFSGYSDIAVGTGRLFGFDLMRNFAYPYFSRDIAEFWRRWHISLFTWFRDYLYIPLGGSRTTHSLAIRNILIVFVVSGFWHGANWTFLVWGALNGLYFVPLFVRGSNRTHLDVPAHGRLLPTLKEAAQIGLTFGLTMLAWVFFRSPSVTGAIGYLWHFLSNPWIHPLHVSSRAMVLALLLLGWEWVQRERAHGLEVSWMPPWPRRLVYLTVWTIVLQTAGAQRDFIYFQF